MEDAGKVCALCGCDCTNKPRVKDAKGRYYCRECHDRARQKSQHTVARGGGSRTPSAARTPSSTDEAQPIDALYALAQTERTTRPASSRLACPGCGATIAGGVICMACGYDTRTDKRLSMQVNTAAAGKTVATASRASAAGGKALRGTLEYGKPILFGCLGGMVGAVVWAATAYGLNRQFGLLAIGVGALTGLGVRWGGGINPVHGFLAAGIAIASICAGKVAAVNYAISHSPEFRRAVSNTAPVRLMMSTVFSQEVYEEIKQKAQAFAQLKSRSEYPAFMVEQGYSGEAKAQDVAPEEVAGFIADTIPILQRFNARNPTYEQWRTQESALIMNKAAAEVSFADMLKGTTGVMDILFFLLAIGAAYRIPAGQGILEG